MSDQDAAIKRSQALRDTRIAFLRARGIKAEPSHVLGSVRIYATDLTKLIRELRRLDKWEP